MSAKAYVAVIVVLGLSACSSDDEKQTPVVIEAFTVTPDALTATADVTLSWTVRGATTVSIDPQIGEVAGASLTTAVYAPTRFVLTASNEAGSVSATASVTMTLPAFVATVDSSLVPGVTELEGSGAVAACADAAGIQTDFIIDEVRIRPRDQAELDAFVARVGGQVVGDDAVPAAPAQLGLDVAAEPTEYRVRFDSTGASLATLTEDAAAAGLGGAMRFSSDRALAFFAAVTHEAAGGVRVWPNFVSYGSNVLFNTREMPSGPGTFLDTFNSANFPRLQNTGSRSSVVQAWQWLLSHGIARTTSVAIVDGGFWLDTQGRPMTPVGDASDFDPVLAQYDFVASDYFADGANPMNCSGGSSCPWHGTGSMATAVANVNNSAGAAGSGGIVATAMPLKVNGSMQQTHSAVRTAAAWGADVINLSLGGRCNLACRQYDRKDLVYAEAIERGAVVVVAAGNDNADVFADNYYHPCINDGVICVGALADQASTRIGYSNFGAGVDIWAATNHISTQDGANPGALRSFGGTSAASPFVAGIVAMMKAIDPSLNADQVLTILRDTAWRDSPDGDVTHMVNALAALRRVSHDELPVDGLEPNQTNDAAEPVTSATYGDLRISTQSDVDSFTFTLSGKSTVTVGLAYPKGIGELLVRDGGLQGTVSCGLVAQLTDVGTPTGRTITYTLPQGTYALALGAKGALPFDLTVNAVPTDGFIATDAYEPNNTLAMPRGINGSSVIRGTLPTGDVDVFQLYSAGTYNNSVLTLSTFAEVLSADVPVTVAVYDGDDNEVGSSTTSGDCSTRARVAIPQGTHRVLVLASAPTSYVLYVGSKIVEHPQYILPDAFELITHPGDPIELFMTEPEQWVVLQNQTDFDSAAIAVLTPSIHISVFAMDGTLLADGVATERDGTVGESVLTPGSTANSQILVRLQRTLEDGTAIGAASVPVEVSMVLEQAL